MKKIKDSCLFILAALIYFSCNNGDDIGPTNTTADALATEARARDDNNDNGIQIPFADAEVFFEFNTTDNDLGLQVFLDAEGWKKVKVGQAGKEELVEIETEGNLSVLGITELRFESAEPSPAEVLALFPPGDYIFKGRTVEGDRLMSIAELSHDFLPAPTFSPSDGEAVDPANTVVTWNAPEAELVEIIIENEDSDATFDVIVPGSTTSLNIPPQFLDPDTEFKIEILVIAENGNRTIVESTFVTSSASI